MSAGEKTIFSMQERTFTRAAGVSPPWFAEPSAVPRKSRTVRRPCDAGPRAAGVSPPCFANRVCNCNTLDFHDVGLHTGYIPREAYAPRSGCSANVCRRKNDFCDARTHIHKSGGRQPAVVSKNASATASDLRGVVTFATAQSAPAPRGADAPRSWCSANVCRPKNDFCGARTQVHKSGVRQPAVVCTWWSVAHGVPQITCKYVSRTHGGLTPPALGAERRSAGEKTIFSMHERTFTRAAGVSPPWFAEPSAVPRKSHTVRRPCDA
jgi:hypothetical protein